MPSLVRMIVREEAKVVGWMMTRLLMMVQDSGYFIMKLRTYLHKKFNVSKSKQQRGVWGFRLKMRMLCENRSKEDFWYFLTVPMKGWKRDHFRLQISSSLCWGKSKMKLFHAQHSRKKRICDDVDDKNFHFDVRKLLLGRWFLMLPYCVPSRVKAAQQHRRIKHDCLLFLTGRSHSVLSAEK